MRTIASPHIDKVSENHPADLTARDNVQDAGKSGVILAIQLDTDFRREPSGFTTLIDFQGRVQTARTAVMGLWPIPSSRMVTECVPARFNSAARSRLRSVPLVRIEGCIPRSRA